jgi:hypothetical protein
VIDEQKLEQLEKDALYRKRHGIGVRLPPDTILELVGELRVLRRALEIAVEDISEMDKASLYSAETYCEIAEREL